MKIKIFCRCSLFPSWSGYGLISTPVLLPHPYSPQMLSWSGQEQFYVMLLEGCKFEQWGCVKVGK